MKEHEFDYINNRLTAIEILMTSLVGQLGANFTPLTDATNAMLDTFASERESIERRLSLAQLNNEDRYVDGSPVVTVDWLGQNHDVLRRYLATSIMAGGCQLGGVTMEQLKPHKTLYRRYGGDWSGVDILTLPLRTGSLEIARGRHSSSVASSVLVQGDKCRRVVGDICFTENEVLDALKDLYLTVGKDWPMHRTQGDVELLIAESKLAEFHVIDGQSAFPTIELAVGPWNLRYPVQFGNLRVYYGEIEVPWERLRTGETDAIYHRVKEELEKQYLEITA